MGTERTLLLFLLPLRLACGYALLVAGLAKAAAGWLTSPLLGVRLSEWLKSGHLHPYTEVLVRHLQHHAQLYSTALAAGEVVAGAALIFGLFGRFSALFGAVTALVPLLGPLEGAERSAALVLFAGLLSLGLASAGRVLGLDALLRPRLPPWLT